MIELVFVLLLYSNGEAIEYTPYDKLSECLSTKRTIKRNVNGGVNFDNQWKCKELKVKLEKNLDGSYDIVELIEE
tara:strand:+ start:205 stop:429 length:225 start_codon:yes stop_codon:yes gene_type:complete